MVFTISLFGLAVTLLIILLIVSFLLFKKRKGEGFDMRNSFPFELSYQTRFQDSFYTHLLLALFVLAGCGFYATYDLKFSNGYLIFMMVGGILSTLAIYALFYNPFIRLKLHIINVAISFALTLAISTSIIIYSFLLTKNHLSWASITSIVLSSLSTIAILAIMINPRMDLNIRFKEVVLENGEKEYVRPKYVTLAISEWLLIFLNIFNMLNIVIVLFAIK